MVLLQTTPTSQTYDSVVLLIIVICIVVGGGSVLFGWLFPNDTDDADLLSSDDGAGDYDNAVSNGGDGSTKGYTGAMTPPTQDIDTAQLDVILFDILVERTAKAYDAKLFDSLTKAIEVNFDCSRQPESRDKSLYQRALKAVRPQSERYAAEMQAQAKTTPAPQGANGDPIVEWITDGAVNVAVREDKYGQKYALNGLQRIPRDLYVDDDLEAAA